MEKIISCKKIEHDCPVCDKIHEVEKITRIISSTIKDESVEHEETVFKCPLKGEEWYHGKMLDDTLLSARDAYRVKHKLLTSDQIIALRKKYGINQGEFSILLGWGAATMSRYETTHIQDESYDNIMRLALGNPAFVLDRLIKHKDHFDPDKFTKLVTSLKEKIKADGNVQLKRQEIMNHYVDYDIESDTNGFKLLDIDKIADVIAYFANYVKNLYKVKLMKLLWYTDVLFYNKYGMSMTGLVYLHKPFGALPIGHNEIIHLPSVLVDEEETEYGTSYHISPLLTPVNPTFSLEEQAVLNIVAIKFRDMRSKEISDYMHDEDAYKNTANDEIILYSQASGVKL